MNQEPLIVSEAAIRRLKLLRGHGVQLPRGLEGVCRALQTPFEVLRVELLQQQQHIDNAGGGTLNANHRKISISQDLVPEVAATETTLASLQIHAGDLVSVSNACRTEVAPHLACIAVLQSGQDNVVYVAPNLAYNLGMALHLWPYIHQTPSSQPDTAETDFLHNQSRVRLLSNNEQLKISVYDDTTDIYTAQTNQPESREIISLPRSDGDANIPLAQEVHLSIVRLPAADLLSSARSKTNAATTKEDEESDQLPADSNMTNKAAAEKSHLLSSDNDDNVQAIQQYFLSKLRLVCLGDVLVMEKLNSDSRRRRLLANIFNPLENTQVDGGVVAMQYIPELLYLRVVKLVPDIGSSQAVDVRKTLVKLTGSCSSGIPVGLPEYLARQSLPSTLGINLLDTTSAMEKLQHTGWLMHTWRSLTQLLAPTLHPVAANVPLRLALLLHGPPGSGKKIAVEAAATAIGYHVISLSCHEIKNNSTTEQKVLEGLKQVFSLAARYRPTLLLLRHFHILGQGERGSGNGPAAARAGAVLKELILENFKSDSADHGSPSALFPAPVILIGCTNNADDIAPALRRCFTHELQVDAPDESDRRQLLSSFMGNASHSLGLEGLDDVARHSAGMLPRDLRSLAADICAAAAVSSTTAVDQVAKVLTNGTKSNSEDTHQIMPSLNEDHVAAALERVRARLAEDIGAPKIPNVKWEDVGGLEDVKHAILDTVELPLKHPQLFAGGLRRRSGVLLYGPPGTGKTLLAKAVATECAINFMSVKGPELINMYVGESERQIRELFERARRARPCVVFFDELDSLAPARGRGSDSGGVMDRVVSQLLAEIDGVQGGSDSADLFVIGATNRPDLLDPALLRPGRLDKLLYVGVASTSESRFQVLKALTRKFVLDDAVNLEDIAARCPLRLTGADMYALCADAWMIALRRRIAEEGNASVHNAKEAAVQVGQDDFIAALQNLRPSLTEGDLAKYDALQTQYAG